MGLFAEIKLDLLTGNRAGMTIFAFKLMIRKNEYKKNPNHRRQRIYRQHNC